MRIVGAANVSHYSTLMHWNAFDLENMDAEVGFLLPKPLGRDVNDNCEWRSSCSCATHKPTLKTSCELSTVMG